MQKHRIVLRTNNHLGDVVILTGVVANIKANYPEVDLQIYANPNYLQIFENNPNISNFRFGDVAMSCSYNPFSQRTANGVTHIEGFTTSILQRLSSYLRKPNKNIIVKRTADIYIPVRENLYGDYCVINANCQTCSEVKGYPYYQQIIDLCPNMKFVQVGGSEERDITGDLKGVIDLRGKTTVRDLVSIVANAKCVLSPSSAVVHIASAFPSVKTIVLTGAREPVMLTKYQNAIHFSTSCGGYNSCNGCMKFRTSEGTSKRCTNCAKIGDRYYAKCMCDIDPAKVAEQLNCIPKLGS